MKRWKLVLYSVLICLPAVLAVVLVTFKSVDDLRSATSREKLRVTMTYRQAAVRLKQDVRTNRLAGVTFRSPTNPRGWQSVGKISKKDDRPWGIGSTNGMQVIWFRIRKQDICYQQAPEVRPVDISGEQINLVLCVFMDFVLCLMTFIAVWYFVRFMKERDDFLAATAHDLTTPLVGMRMTIGRNDDEAKRLNERMLLIVGNIKDFLRLGGRRKSPEPKTFDLVALCKEAYRLFAADYEDSDGGAVEFDCSRLQAATVEALADETMTLQILWNLFGNDLKYAAPYGRVTVRFANEDGFVRVEFADEGQGMTPRQMKRAFDRYYRAKTVLESGKGGFGIGLCTAREFARAMGGDLTVRANEPKGCVFVLTLPQGKTTETGK